MTRIEAINAITAVLNTEVDSGLKSAILAQEILDRLLEAGMQYPTDDNVVSLFSEESNEKK